MGNALAVYDKVADPIAAAEKMALAYGKVCGASSKEEGIAIVLTCMMEGMTPLEFGRRYHMVEGKPTQKTDSMLADFVQAGGKYVINECSPERTSITFFWDGQSYEREFTWEQAKESRWPWRDFRDKEKGLKHNWSTPVDREAMLWHRCVSTNLRRIAATLFYGIYTPEEMRDVEETPTNGQPVVETVKKTALEVAKEAAAAAVATVATATGEVVDAEFEPAKEESPPWKEPATQEPIGELTPSSTGSVTPQQLEQLASLFEALVISEDDQKAALAKRKRERFEDLSKNEAKEMIDRLEAVKAQRGKH